MKRIIPLSWHPDNYFTLVASDSGFIRWRISEPIKQALDLFPYCLLLLLDNYLLFVHDFPSLFLEIQLQLALISGAILIETFKLL